MLEIDGHHGGGFLLSNISWRREQHRCMTNRQSGLPRNEHAPPTAQRRPPQPAPQLTLRNSAP